MKSKNELNMTCNIFIPRNIYSLFLVLSKKKFLKNDDYIIINTHKFYSHKIPIEIITFLKQKKYKIIIIDKPYNFKKSKNLSDNFINNFFKINFFKIINQTSNEILKVKYNEFKTINFYNYKKINIYYGANFIYFNNFCNKFKNTNLFFLEHGIGNFFNMLPNKNSYKELIINFIKYFYLKIKRINIVNHSYYFGICSNLFNYKKLKYEYINILFLRRNYKKGFNFIYNDFFKNKLKNIKKIKNANYIFINIPYHYQIKAYKNYLNYVSEKIKKKDNIVVLIKQHPKFLKKEKYLNSLLLTLRKEKIRFYQINKKLSEFPIEVLIKYFSIKEIYSPVSMILFSSTYFVNNNIRLNLLFSQKIKNKYKNFTELKRNALDFIKKEFIYNNLTITNIDKN